MKKENQINELLKDITEIKAKYDEVRDKERFNIFTALHKERDEVRLHSRTISYLLSPKSGHGMGNTFLKVFVRDILKVSEASFELEGAIVIPNEFNKTEYKEIDILIINKATKQAIIVENKIDAKDSNHKGKDPGYNGQLERYYNAIKKGKSKESDPVSDFQCNTVFVYYLTLDNHDSSEESIGEGDLKKKDGLLKNISYGNQIIEWLELCKQELAEDKVEVENFIQHYLNLIKRMTHNDISIEERKEIKGRVAKNWEETKYLIDNFKHVKWHTVEEFWRSLKEELKAFNNVQYYTSLDDYKNPTSEMSEDFIKTIGLVTHENKRLNYGLTFDDKNGKKLYISGENALSWGVIEPKKWSDFEDENLQSINFSDFSTNNTYRLIDSKLVECVVRRIVEEINLGVDDDYVGLNIG